MEKNKDQKINKNYITPQTKHHQTTALRTTVSRGTTLQAGQSRTIPPEIPHHHSSHASHIQPHHGHPHENTKAVLNRLSRAIGHLKSIKVMVEDGRDCSEVLIQLSAVKAAINNTGKVVLKDHLSHCLIDSIETGNMEAIEELNKAIDQFVK